MTHQQYSDHIKLCWYLGKEPQGGFKEFHDFITDLWEDMEFSVNNEQDIIFHKGTVFYMEQDFKYGYLWCHCDRVWSFLEDQKGLELPEIQDFVRNVVEEQLKCKALTPISSIV